MNQCTMPKCWHSPDQNMPNVIVSKTTLLPLDTNHEINTRFHFRHTPVNKNKRQNHAKGFACFCQQTSSGTFSRKTCSSGFVVQQERHVVCTCNSCWKDAHRRTHSSSNPSTRLLVLRWWKSIIRLRAFHAHHAWRLQAYPPHEYRFRGHCIYASSLRPISEDCPSSHAISSYVRPRRNEIKAVAGWTFTNRESL